MLDIPTRKPLQFYTHLQLQLVNYISSIKTQQHFLQCNLSANNFTVGGKFASKVRQSSTCFSICWSSEQLGRRLLRISFTISSFWFRSCGSSSRSTLKAWYHEDEENEEEEEEHENHKSDLATEGEVVVIRELNLLILLLRTLNIVRSTHAGHSFSDSFVRYM